jgi:ABC-type Fe3+/spermidine/putrescine transport system ATPase subunit
VVALKDINLDIPQGQFVCLLGPSGCGKSTLLNAIAGFSPPSSGEITADAKLVTGPGPERGMVFQEYALFPWMTVEKNIAFGLEIKGMAAGRRSSSTVDRSCCKDAVAERLPATASRKTCRAGCASGWRSPGCSRWTHPSC